MDFGHFHEFPALIKTGCSVASGAADPFQCDINTGWHVNQNYNLQSNLARNGIPGGLKLHMKAFIGVQNPAGGELVMSYKMTGFKSHLEKNQFKQEFFRVLINGEIKLLASKDTVS